MFLSPVRDHPAAGSLIARILTQLYRIRRILFWKRLKPQGQRDDKIGRPRAEVNATGRDANHAYQEPKLSTHPRGILLGAFADVSIFKSRAVKEMALQRG
jgi:hypothetical protein